MPRALGWAPALITIKRRRDRTPKLRSRNSHSANRRAATERWRKSSKPLCYPLPQLYAPASSIALSSTGSFAVRIFWPYGGNCSISSNDILNPFTPFGGGSLIRMANLHANILQIGQPERMPELFAMILARSARAHEPRRLRPESQQSRRCRDH